MYLIDLPDITVDMRRFDKASNNIINHFCFIHLEIDMNLNLIINYHYRKDMSYGKR